MVQRECKESAGVHLSKVIREETNKPAKGSCSIKVERESTIQLTQEQDPTPKEQQSEEDEPLDRRTVIHSVESKVCGLTMEGKKEVIRDGFISFPLA